MQAIDRDILRLAIPTLGALAAEPLFVLVDTAMVGHLGAASLGGLSIASTVLQTVIGLLIFLAYATTPTVARRLGSGDRAGAIRAGIDGMWLALFIGLGLVFVGLLAGRPLVAGFGSTLEVTTAAETYLTLSLWGLPAMLLVIAATGLLRGLQDTTTPLIVAGVGFTANALLNWLLIYGLGLGIAGAAIGTVIAQWGMAAVYIVMAVRAARSQGTVLRPGLRGVSSVAGSGLWLIVRTASLRAALVATVVVASGIGVTELGTLQIATSIFMLLAFVLDALAIAGQTLIGHGLGAGDVPRVTAITRRLIVLSLWSGVGLGLLVAVTAPWVGAVFTGDQGIRNALVPTLFVLALGIPLGGYVFALDGVLIGAGDVRYLALTGILNLAAYLPLLLWVALARPDQAAAWLWAAFGLGYLAARAVTLGLRARSSRWIVTGAG